MLFSFLTAAQLIHVHQATEKSLQEQSVEKESVQLSDKCSVCDYFHHIQGKQIFLGQQFLLPVLFPKAITIRPLLYTGNYNITLQGFTNKGPPYIS